MSQMTAYRLTDWGRPAQFVDVGIPSPGPGEVLVKMAAVGLCGSDIHLFKAAARALPFSPPFTLGHENAGWVAQCGVIAARGFILAFAASCVLGSVYGFLQGDWPFGVIEAIWAVVALRRWATRGTPS